MGIFGNSENKAPFPQFGVTRMLY